MSGSYRYVPLPHARRRRWPRKWVERVIMALIVTGSFLGLTALLGALGIAVWLAFLVGLHQATRKRTPAPTHPYDNL